MAYMRGDPYIWGDKEDLHIWSAVAAEDVSDAEMFADSPSAVGVRLPHATADAIALMRVAELVRLGQLEHAIAHTLMVHGQNFGASALRQIGPGLVVACRPLVAV